MSPESDRREWKLSRYTAVVESESGDLLLHNSFMGALARVPAGDVPRVERFLGSSPDLHGPSMYRRPSAAPASRIVQPSELDDPFLRELCEGRFFVPADMDEQKAVTDLLTREREAGFSLIVLPHENCNFRCVYCYETFERGKMTRPVVEGLKAFVDRKALEVPSLTVAWFGGEPLLARDVLLDLSDAFLDSCERRGVQYSSTMTTNGYFLTVPVVDRLLERKITRFQVTVDGSEATHNQQRPLSGGGGTYKTIIHNLCEMKKRDQSFQVTIRVNFKQSTVPSLEAFLQEISPLFRGDSRFTLDFQSVGTWGGPNDSSLDICDAESSAAVKAALLKTSFALGATPRSLRGMLVSHGTACYAGKPSSIVVGSDGTVYKCTVAFSDPRNHVGRLLPSGELEIDQARWNLWTQLDDKDTEKCGGCSFNPSCQSRSCPLAAIDQRQPPCPVGDVEYVSLVRLAASAAHRDAVA